MLDLSEAIAIMWTQADVNDIDVYVYVFAFFFAGAWLLLRLSPVMERYFSAETAIVNFLKNRELFYVGDAAREEVWLNLLRMITGFMFFQRSFYIFYYEVAMGEQTSITLITLFITVAAFLLMIGFLTPVAAAFLFFFHTYVHDHLLGTFTLGSCVAQILILVLLFTPTGRRLSLDNLIMHSRSIGAGGLERLYRFVGTPTVNRIAIIKLCAFISYGLLCMYSVYEHMLDPYWANGTANVLILSSNWLTNPHQFFREVFTEYGAIAIIISMIALYIMMAWELVIIPFALFKGPTRWFVIWWGIAFFVVSLFILQLSWLPHYQFVLYGIFFWPGWLNNRDGKRSLQIYYDDRCNLCDRTVRFLMAVDWFRVVQLRPLSKSGEEIAVRGLTEQQVFDDLYGYDPHSGAIYSGYNLYMQFAARIFILAPLYPFLWLGRLVQIGPVIYGYIAARRRRIFGVCEVPTVNLAYAQARESMQPVTTERNQLLLAFLMTYTLFLGIYLIKFPYFSHIPGWSTVQRQFEFVGSVPPAINGQIPIIVFTPQVMTMGSHYFTITGVFPNDEERLLPYVGPEGDRLDLVRQSDRLYFGHSLAWRRMMYGRDDDRVCYEQERDDKFLFNLFGLAERYWGENPDHFRVDYYHQPIPDPEAAANYEYKLEPREHVCTVVVRPQQLWVVEQPEPIQPPSQ